MAMEIRDMKPAYMFAGQDNASIMLDFIKDRMGVEDADWSTYCGRYVIYVDPKKYKKIITIGRTMAARNNWKDICWLDEYGIIRSAIGTCDVAYAYLPKGEVEGEELCGFRKAWGYDDKQTPKILLDYFKSMADYLQVPLIREYNTADNAITLSPRDTDYEYQEEMIRQFIEKNGYGPFESIYPLTTTGKLIRKPFKIK